MFLEISYDNPLSMSCMEEWNSHDFSMLKKLNHMANFPNFYLYNFWLTLKCHDSSSKFLKENLKA